MTTTDKPTNEQCQITADRDALLTELTQLADYYAAYRQHRNDGPSEAIYRARALIEQVTSRIPGADGRLAS